MKRKKEPSVVKKQKVKFVDDGTSPSRSPAPSKSKKHVELDQQTIIQKKKTYILLGVLVMGLGFFFYTISTPPRIVRIAAVILCGSQRGDIPFLWD